MLYYSTNKQTAPVSLKEAVVKGLAPDKEKGDRMDSASDTKVGLFSGTEP